MEAGAPLDFCTGPHTPASRRSGALRRKPPARFPVLAVCLAALSVALGWVGYQQVTAQPTEPITFVVDEGLPYGITQESVEAAAEGVALGYQPFTMHVVERELEWEETNHHEIGDADLILSVGDDADDPDLPIPDSSRVAFAVEDDDVWRDAAQIRGTFVNNRTLGHGPSAVVGAALTASNLRFDDGVGSPVLWGSLAALPMFAAILAMFAWLRRRRIEHARYREFSEAQLRLARSVLELETVKARVDLTEAVLSEAEAEDASSSSGASASPAHTLQRDWALIRELSLDLAREEQALLRELDDAALRDFAADTLDLQHRTDAVSEAAEVHSGHAGSRSVLDRLALPLLHSIDDVLAHRSRFPAEAQELETHRARLLSIAQEVASDVGSAGLVANHREVLERWDSVEQDIRTIAARISRRVSKPKRSAGTADTIALNDAVEERASRRVSAATAGATDSFRQLRASLGLGHGSELGPLQATERALELLERLDDQPARVADVPTTKRGISWGTAAVLLPVLLGLAAGWVAVGQSDSNTAYGRTLTGDQPLAELRVYGDPARIPDLKDPLEGEPSNAQTLDLQYVRSRMQRSVEFSDTTALLPDRLELTVALLPIDEYAEYQPHPEYDERLWIDYWEMLEAQRKLKHDVAQQYPQVLDAETGEVARGQGILPIWLLPDGNYAIGYTLTGEISSGVDSRMGAYYFNATEPRVIGRDDFDIPVGDLIAYDLGDLGRAMEYNHQELSHVSPGALFWIVAVSVWTGAQTLILLGVAVAEAGRRRAGTVASRRQLASLRADLESLALGLDLSRLDMVAVLGLDSPTDGRAEQAEQRLYEMGLVTAWREVQALENLPRREQRGEAWQSRIRHVQHLVETLTTRDADVSRRADEMARVQRLS
ncbi:hypothetical protein [Citricoccus sp. GCM10030269]|uniref:hypothetical protein n=1 Tax=Citricoccus sp. GCM10030269 TaxID=3273388 RepID=UPI00361F5538